MVISVTDDIARLERLKQDRVGDALIQVISKLIEAYVNSERRLACLEQRSDLGVASFLVLWDLFPNVRNNGALTKEVADFTLDEIVAYLEERGGQQCARLKHLVMALQNPDGAWE